MFDEIEFDDILLSVLGRQVVRPMPHITLGDSVSREMGDMDGFSHCGDRNFELIGASPSYYSGKDDLAEMQFQTSKFDDVGRFTLEIKVSLAFYPEISQSKTFTLTIDPCKVSSFTGIALPSSALTYNLGQGELAGFEYRFSQMNACSYSESIQVLDSPAFMVHDKEKANFLINTDQVSDVGDYLVTV